LSGARRLAAILAVDVAGYSRLMGEDEAGTAKAVRERREAAAPIVRAFGGRLVKTTGDGVLLEFPSVVAAVECAILIQKMMAERNAALPEAKRIRYRIGVNLGDVLIEGDDILGDGVNVAARLEGICEPGGVCVSGAAVEHVQGRVAAEFAELGEQSLKNIARPVRAYALSPHAVAAAQVEQPEAAVNAPAAPAPPPAPKARGGFALRSLLAAAVALALVLTGWLGWRAYAPTTPAAVATGEDKLAQAPRLSIVVLPFDNLSGDPDQNYFAEGITEDLTTDLSHLQDAFVIARGTAYSYKGKPIDVKAIGRELGVRYALEGSVRRVGERITINAQLLSTETGAHVWADRFEGERAKLGELQVDTVARIANALGVQLVRAEALRAARERPNNPDAADLAMQGWVKNNGQLTRETSDEAVALFDRALALDPNNVLALAGLANSLASRVIQGYSDDPGADVARAETAANRAIAAEPESSQAHMARFWSLYARHKNREAIAEAETAIGLDPNNAAAHAQAGSLKMFLGRSEDGFAGLKTALRLSPHDPGVRDWQFNICHLHTHLAQWDQAIEWCSKATAGNPQDWFSYVDLATANAWLGHDKEARDAAAQLQQVFPGFTVQTFAGIAAQFSNDPTFAAQIQRILEGLRKAGVPEGDKPSN